MITENPKEILAWAKEKYQETVSDIVSDVDGYMADAATEMENIIETVPSSLKKGKVGRVWTGEMLESVDYEELTPISRNKWRGAFGWTSNREKYFGSQESGTGDKSGEGGVRNISPMHALTGAKIGFIEAVKARWR